MNEALSCYFAFEKVEGEIWHFLFSASSTTSEVNPRDHFQPFSWLGSEVITKPVQTGAAAVYHVITPLSAFLDHPFITTSLFSVLLLQRLELTRLRGSRSQVSCGFSRIEREESAHFDCVSRELL